MSQRPEGGGGGWLNMWQRDSIWCYLPEECHRCLTLRLGHAGMMPLEILWAAVKLAAKWDNAEMQTNSFIFCWGEAEFFFDFSKMFFLSRTNWWGVPGIQPLMSLRVTESHWASLLLCDLLETHQPRRDSFVSPFRIRPFCGSLHGVRTKYKDIAAFPLRSSPFSTRPPYPRCSTQLVPIVRRLAWTFLAAESMSRSCCWSRVLAVWYQHNTDKLHDWTSDNGSCHAKPCRLSMRHPVEHKLQVIRISLQLEHTTIKTKCCFQRRVEDSWAAFLGFEKFVPLVERASTLSADWWGGPGVRFTQEMSTSVIKNSALWNWGETFSKPRQKSRCLPLNSTDQQASSTKNKLIYTVAFIFPYSHNIYTHEPAFSKPA